VGPLFLGTALVVLAAHDLEQNVFPRFSYGSIDEQVLHSEGLAKYFSLLAAFAARFLNIVPQEREQNFPKLPALGKKEIEQC
jgi:hypothetical protein